jgi:DNA-binding NtrC family response regulator
MDHEWKIIVASSDLETRQLVLQILHRLGVDAIGASTVTECRQILVQDTVGLVFCDHDLNDGGYRDVLAAADCKSARSKLLFVLMSSIINPEEYDAARQAGLFEVIASPCRPTDVEWMVILEKRLQRTRTKQLVSAPPIMGQKATN